MAFDFTINLGHVITIASVIAAGGVYHQRLKTMETDLHEIKEDLRVSIKDMVLVNTTAAVTSQRVMTLEEDMKAVRGHIHDLRNMILGRKPSDGP